MENFIAYLVIMGAVTCGIIIGNLISSLIQVRIFTGKRFLKKLMKRTRKTMLKETQKTIEAFSALEED